MARPQTNLTTFEIPHRGSRVSLTKEDAFTEGNTQYLDVGVLLGTLRRICVPKEPLCKAGCLRVNAFPFDHP
jgi:hypothetical protein